MTDLVCKGCGGPLILNRSGQMVILPSVSITTDGDQLVEKKTTDNAWCGDCIDAWNESIGDKSDGGV